MSEHLSRRTLEAASIDDLAAGDRARVDAHLASCATCRDVVSALKGDQQRTMAELPPERFMLGVRARRARARRPVIYATATTLAMAAAIAFFVWPREGDLRMKGDGLSIYVRRDGVVRVLDPSERITVGDTLQLAASLPQPSAVSAFIVDGDAVSPIANGEHVAAGEHELGPSATIDPPCHDLAIVFVRDRVPTIDEVRQIARAPARPYVVRRLRCR